MKFVVLAAACGLLLSPAASMASDGAVAAAQSAPAASGAEPAQPAQPAAPVAKPKKEKKICRRSGETESRLGGSSICKTQAEWDAMKGSTPGSAADH